MTPDPLQPLPTAPPTQYAAPAPAPRRPRPSGWWFVVGGTAVVLGIVVGIALFVWTLVSVFDTEATVSADGLAHRVSLNGDDQRMVWGRSKDGSDCTIIDSATGAEVTTSPLSGSFTKDGGSGSWVGVENFEPGSGELDVTCQSAGGPIQIGPATEITSFVGRIFATILVPLLLGGFGLVTLLITGVLFATREPRRPSGSSAGSTAG